MNEQLIQNNPNEPLDFRADERLQALVDAAAAVLAEHDSGAESLRDELFIDTASEDGLQKRATALGVEEGAADTVEQFRTRVRGTIAAQSSATTIDDFATLVSLVIGVDPGEFTITDSGDELAVTVSVDDQTIEQTAFNVDEMASLLSDAVPASHSVVIKTTGTFELDGPAYEPSDESGLNEGTLGQSIPAN